MAVLDHQTPAVVLGIVYDGPPEAGKTTSVRALARSFGREVYTPEERDGRTVYFDWLEHTGGRFDGAPLRFQIMSVPGQTCWAQRREQLLERADVVVFVGDTSASGWRATRARLRELRSWLDARPGPPVGVVFQANRRDAPDAVPLAEVRKDIDSSLVALVESVAIDGSGVREAFVFAVRLALDRVREEQRLGSLGSLTEDMNGPALLRQLVALESAAEAQLVATAAPAPSAATVPRPHQRARTAHVPSHEVASGLVWPPVEGRILLREAVTAPIRGEPDAAGNLAALLPNGHRAQSPSRAVSDDLDHGREMLVSWARLHSGAQALLSKARCLVLAETDDGRFRLWQIVRREPTLRELFVDGSDTLIARHAARQLGTASRLLAQAYAKCESGTWALECSLDSIGASELGEAIYVANAPFSTEELRPSLTPDAVAQELSALFRGKSSEERAELARSLAHYQSREPGATRASPVGQLLSRYLTS